MDIPEFQGPEEQQEHSEPSMPSKLTRLWEPLTDPFPEDKSYVDVMCLIVLSNDRMFTSQSTIIGAKRRWQGISYSKNTVKALAAIWWELQPNVEEPEED